jgi:4-methylaminobutanoate oxidase (formaldehyde-forming)
MLTTDAILDDTVVLPSPDTATGSGKRTPRILVADDEPRIRLSIRACLEAAGYDVTEAADGEEALDRIIRDAPDVMILDLAMPNLDGIRTLGELCGVHGQLKPRVIVMDMSFMGKFLVQGRDAGRSLNLISAGNVDGPVGKITYTPWLNEHGLLEADLTVSKLSEDAYLVVVTDTMVRHAHTWMKRHFPQDAHVTITDVTSGYAQLNVQGPRSRELLQSITSVDLSNAAFPFRTVREIDIGFARAWCVRITYVGELGYELYIPAEQALHVYDRIIRAGAPFNLAHAGLLALSSLRLEKGYRDYGHDIDNTDDPDSAGLGFALDTKKPEGFIGKEAVLARRARGAPGRRLVQVFVEDPIPLMFHSEVVRRDGIPVGYVRAGSYGHTLGGAVGLAMIDGQGSAADAKYFESGRWEVDIAGSLHPAAVSMRPMYDPKNTRVSG